MKRAFSSVACMDLSYREIAFSAKKAGIHAVELRMEQNGNICGLKKEELSWLSKCLKENELKVSNLGTSISLFEYDGEKVKEAARCAELASLVEARGIRIFPGRFIKRFSDDAACCYQGMVRALKEICAGAKNCGVEIWLETHNNFSTGKALRKLCDDVDCDNLKVIWDIIHPIEAGESPEETVKYIGEKIAHVHIKDGVKSGDSDIIDYTYTRLGYGQLPVGEIMEQLRRIRYGGYVSLEWERAWREEICNEYSDLEELLRDFNEFMDAVENNLLPPVESSAWRNFVPVGNGMGAFSRGTFHESLNITLDGRRYGVGKWMARVPVKAGKTYDFSACALCSCPVNDIYALYTLFRADGSMLIREHIRNTEKAGDRIRFSQKIETPQDAVSFEIELWLKGKGGFVKWHNPTLSAGTPAKERSVGIAVAYIPPKEDYTLESNLEDIEEILECSGKMGADIIVLGECMYERGVPGITLGEAAQSDKGEMCTRIGETAAKYGAYIVYNFHEMEEGQYYNTSVLFDRQGKICGKYRKTHLTVTEFEKGIVPGEEYPVFQTDFGKVGMLICFDHYFASTAEKLVENGAELILVSSAGDAAEKSIARAMDCGVYLAVCGWNMENSHGWGPGRIIAPDGSILADTGEKNKPAFCRVDLNRPVRRHWLSLGPALSEIYGVYKYEKTYTSSL